MAAKYLNTQIVFILICAAEGSVTHYADAGAASAAVASFDALNFNKKKLVSSSMCRDRSLQIENVFALTSIS